MTTDIQPVVPEPAAPSQTQAAPEAVPVSPDYDEKFFAALGYFGPLFVISFIAKPKSAYCKFHALQSVVLFGAFLLCLIVLAIIPMIGSVFTMVLFAIYVLSIYRAYQGDRWNVPFLEKITAKINTDAIYQKAGLAVSNISGMKEAGASLAEKVGSAAEHVTKQEEEEENPKSQNPNSK